jgi:hypothetical protein
VDVILDRWHNANVGADVPRFISRLEDIRNLVVAVGTPAYREKYENKDASAGTMVAAEVNCINLRLTGTEWQQATVLPVLLEGDESDSLPPLTRGRVYADFRSDEGYFGSLFDLILTMYNIPFENPTVAELRDGHNSVPQSS